MHLKHIRTPLCSDILLSFSLNQLFQSNILDERKHYNMNKVYFMNVFLYSRMLEIGSEDTAKEWSNQDIDLFQYGVVIFPILDNTHFSLYVVANPSELIDSSRGGDYSAYPG